MAGYRKERLEELIRRLVAETILLEVKDPRIGFVTVTRVELSKDYSVANVWYSVIGDEMDKKRTLHGMESARPYIQHVMAKNIRLRVLPRIVFHLDTSIEEGLQVINTIDHLDKG